MPMCPFSFHLWWNALFSSSLTQMQVCYRSILRTPWLFFLIIFLKVFQNWSCHRFKKREREKKKKQRNHPINGISAFFSSLTGWVYQPRPGKRKRYPLAVSAVFSSTTQNIITTNPVAVYPFPSPAFPAAMHSIQKNIGHPVCEFQQWMILKIRNLPIVAAFIHPIV